MVKFPQFLDVPESQFTLFLADANLEISKYNWELLGVNWQAWKDRGIENYIGCSLSKINPEALGSAGLAEFEVKEAGYRVKYLANSGGGTGNPFCAEYARLIGKVQALTPLTSSLPANTCGIRKKVYWD